MPTKNREYIISCKIHKQNKQNINGNNELYRK